MPKSTVVVHVSDFHFCDMSISMGDLKEKHGIMSKRSIGWLNHRIRRKRQFIPEIQDRIISLLSQMKWDHLVISGDLTTLALEQEFKTAKDKIIPLMKKGNIILTPGNHDRYVKSVFKPDLLVKYFGDCFPFNKIQPQNNGINIFELDEQTVLLELDMSIPRSFFSSKGKIRVDLEKHRDILYKKYRNRLKIVVGHYPAFLPPGESEGYLHSLEKIKDLQKFLMECHVDLYLHGHIHKTWHFKPYQNQKLTCINSGGCCRYSDGPWAGFYRIEIKNREYTIKRVSL